MNTAMLARIAKMVALVGFLLPWILVSCSNQTLSSATGFDLAVGSLNIHNPTNGALEHHSGQPDMPILLAMVAVALGLLGSFLLAQRDAARLMLATSLISLLLIFVGVQAAHDPQRLKSALGGTQQSNGSLDQVASDSAMAMIKVENQFGYYLTMMALAATAAMSVATLYGVDALRARASELGGEAARRLAAAAVTASPPPADPDVAFWDCMADKNDPDSLHEYLLRFPSGRFRGLATAKLARQGQVLSSTPPNLMAPAPSMECSRCGTALDITSKFCENCGVVLRTASNT